MEELNKNGIELLTIKDVAEATRISARALWRWIAAGRFPQPDLRVGRVRRWKVSTVVEWIDGQNRRN